MHITNSKTLQALIFGIVIPACGSNSSKPATPDAHVDPAIALAQDMSGRWSSSCLPQTSGFAKLDFQIDTPSWQLDYVVHGNADCTFPLATVAIEGPFEIGDASAVPNAYEAVFGFRSKTITPHVEDLRDTLQAMSCGSEDWVVGESQSVLESGCAGFGQYPVGDCASDYDLVSLQNGQLQFGARPQDNNMCTPDKRPTALADFTLTRQ